MSGVLIVVMFGLLYGYWTEWRFERIRLIGNLIYYTDEYKDYYYKTVYKPNTMPAPFGSNGEIIYFLPGQKKK